MTDIDRMKALKNRYFELVESHGEAIAELRLFQKSLCALNKQHRLEAMKMYEEMILKIETRIDRNGES